MNCPFCNKQIKHLALHIKEEHPKKFNFLKKSKPKLYKRLQTELKLHQMIESKDPNLYILNINSETQYYEYHCVRCGKCCHIWEIEIQQEDVEKWASEGREKLLQYIQLYPKSISVMNLGLIQRLAGIKHVEPSIKHVTLIRNLFDTSNFDVDASIERIFSNEDKLISENTKEKIKSIIYVQTQIIGYYLTYDIKDLDKKIIQNIDHLREFILTNHHYLGEPKVDRWGAPIKDPTIDELKIKLPQFFDEKIGIFQGKVPHWLLGNYGYGPRAILSPKTFNTIKDGWDMGLSYYLIYELGGGGCGFLKNNLCSIHEYKPLACKLFPSNRVNLDPTADKHFLESCKGLKRIY